MKRDSLKLFASFLTVSMTSVASAAPFAEVDGRVTMEAEATGSALGEWVLKKDVDGFGGDGHLEFTGNGPEMGPAGSPLSYVFQVAEDGDYQMMLRCRKRLISKRGDICNDAYVRLEGDYESANDVPLELLKSDTKIYGGEPDRWGGAFRLDKQHKKHDPVYRLKAGEEYTFVMSGRSQNFNVDSIVFARVGEDFQKARAGLVEPAVTGELKQWHRVTVTFDGPWTKEMAKVNPFTDYRLDVTFTQDDESITVPGFFAADGWAGQSGADKGSRWRVHFSPPEAGVWTYDAIFTTGDGVAVSGGGESAGYFDGTFGEIKITPTDKTGSDFRALGRLEYDGTRYLKTAETGQIFFKTGVDSPENLLSYADFDGGFATDGEKDKLVKTWEPHVQDWREGDPIWRDGRGKGLIGAINYLAEQGMNSVSCLTMNIGGDDRNVFPYVSSDAVERFDVSRLAQWEMVFHHASARGMMLHFKTQESENETLLDGGEVGPQRKLYYRELIARFGHHPALTWNLGEENGKWAAHHKKELIQTTEQRLEMAHFFKENDPYQHPRVIHNGQWFGDLYGPETPYTGASIQTSQETFEGVHPAVKRVLKDSLKNGKQWVVSCDEPGDASAALKPDEDDPTHDLARQNALWGSFLAGGYGIEWYFGYKFPNSDLSCQDFRPRAQMWEYCRHATRFFREYASDVGSMNNNNDLLTGVDGFCLADPGNIYVCLVKDASQAASVDLWKNGGSYSVSWYDPRNGGELQEGSVKEVSGKGVQSVGQPPSELEKDWVLLIKKLG